MQYIIDIFLRSCLAYLVHSMNLLPSFPQMVKNAQSLMLCQEHSVQHLSQSLGLRFYSSYKGNGPKILPQMPRTQQEQRELRCRFLR